MTEIMAFYNKEAHYYTHSKIRLLERNAMDSVKLHIFSWIIHFHNTVTVCCRTHTAVSFFNRTVHKLDTEKKDNDFG